MGPFLFPRISALNSKKILVDFEKIKDPFSGLGQVCLHLKKYFDQSTLNINYWMPSGTHKLSRYLNFLMPDCDIFHAIHQDSYYLPFNKEAKFIFTVHDLNYLTQNKKAHRITRYKKRFQSRLDRADIVTFISEFARTDVLKQFKLDINKTQIIYNGISLTDKSLTPNFVPTKKFLFTIGTVLPKKNFHVLIDMMKRLPDYQLVIAGPKHSSYAQDMIQKVKNEGLSDQIFLTGTIDEEHKRWYYENASAFIFPSLLEGFGLPIAEAMSLGLPLFLSTKTSVPEIGGADAYYFENFEADYMADVFKKGMSNFSEDRKNRLIQRSKLFSWEKAALDYMEIYKRI